MNKILTRQAVVQGCMAAFVLAVAASMWAYPGGTWWNWRQAGHSFWQNFLCDLLHDPSLNHRPNALGSALAKVGMLLFVVGLSVFWSMTDQLLCRSPRFAKVVRSLGVFGAPLVAAVPMFPSNRFPKLHTAAVTLGGLPVLLALMLLTVGILVEPHLHRAARVLTALLLPLVLVCLGLYVREAVFGGSSLRVLPVLERVASLLTVLWVLALLPRTRPSPSISRGGRARRADA